MSELGHLDHSGQAEVGVPPARRTRRPSWRDPRIVVGVLIVAVSVLGGAKLLASADDTVAVWAAQRDLPAGTRLAPDALVQRRVRFADAGDAARYFTGPHAPSGSALLARTVGAGELVPRAALGGSDGDALIEVPLAVEPADLPATVRRGAVVDVWATPDPTKGADTTAGAARAADTTRLVLAGVTVIDVPAASGSFSADTTRQVIVGVRRSDDLGASLGRLATGRILLTRRG